MSRLGVGRFLLSAVSLWAAFGSYFFDWNETHIFNPNWPPHAKFHNAQTMLLGTCLGVLTLSLLWLARTEERTVLRIASVLAGLYWITQAGALAFPGTALVDPEFSVPGAPPAQLIVDVVALGILSVGYFLETRRLTRGSK